MTSTPAPPRRNEVSDQEIPHTFKACANDIAVKWWREKMGYDVTPITDPPNFPYQREAFVFTKRGDLDARGEGA